MRKPKLDNRLALIYEMIGDARSVCDVGADHGRLALRLARAGVNVIATDISEPSLKKTMRLIKLHDAEVSCRVGDGLTVVAPDEVDTVVMAGMGQGTITGIISESRDVVDACDTIIMQSMNGEYDLRSYLSDEGFSILDERVAKEGKRIYCVIKAAPRAGAPLNEVQKHFGPIIIRNLKAENTLDYVMRNMRILEDIVSGIELAGGTQSARYVTIKEAIDDMKVML